MSVTLDDPDPPQNKDTLLASGWSESPGGACTHWKAPPCHGAPPFRLLAAAVRLGGRRGKRTLETARQGTGALCTSSKWRMSRDE